MAQVWSVAGSCQAKKGHCQWLVCSRLLQCAAGLCRMLAGCSGKWMVVVAGCLSCYYARLPCLQPLPHTSPPGCNIKDMLLSSSAACFHVQPPNLMIRIRTSGVEFNKESESYIPTPTHRISTFQEIHFCVNRYKYLRLWVRLSSSMQVRS